MAFPFRTSLRRALSALVVPAALATLALAASSPIPSAPRRAAGDLGAPFHLHLERSAPADSSVVSPPDSIQLWFTERPQIAVTRVTVTTASGDTVATAKPTLADADKAPVVVSFVRPPGAGEHTVSWRTMSADGHVVRGTFVFTVRASTP